MCIFNVFVVVLLCCGLGVWCCVWWCSWWLCVVFVICGCFWCICLCVVLLFCVVGLIFLFCCFIILCGCGGGVVLVGRFCYLLISNFSCKGCYLFDVLLCGGVYVFVFILFKKKIKTFF